MVATLKEETAKLKEEREEFAKLVSLGSYFAAHAYFCSKLSFSFLEAHPAHVRMLEGCCL